MSTETYRLQVNDSGSWRNVAHLRPNQVEEVKALAGPLARALGDSPRWRIANSLHAAVVDDSEIRDVGARRIARCVNCGCTDNRACKGGCYWISVDRKAGTGLCSECA